MIFCGVEKGIKKSKARGWKTSGDMDLEFISTVLG